MPYVSSEDDHLVEAMCRGGQDALGHVIDRYTVYVGAIVRNIVRDKLAEVDVEDIVSDVFFSLWQNAEKVLPGKLKGFLAVMARRRAINALRGKNLDVPLEDDELPLPAPGPEDEILQQEEYAALRRTVYAMSEPDRSIFLRHYYSYQTTAEIAAALGIRVSTVQKKLQRGRERLRRELAEGGYFIEREDL